MLEQSFRLPPVGTSRCDAWPHKTVPLSKYTILASGMLRVGSHPIALRGYSGNDGVEIRKAMWSGVCPALLLIFCSSGASARPDDRPAAIAITRSACPARLSIRCPFRCRVTSGWRSIRLSVLGLAPQRRWAARSRPRPPTSDVHDAAPMIASPDRATHAAGWSAYPRVADTRACTAIAPPPAELRSDTCRTSRADAC